MLYKAKKHENVLITGRVPESEKFIMSFYFYLVSVVAGVISLVFAYPPALILGMVSTIIAIVYEGVVSYRE